MQTFPVTPEDIEGKKDDAKGDEPGWRLDKIGNEMASIRFGDDAFDKVNLWSIVRNMDASDKFLYSQDENLVLDTIRDGLAIQEYFYNTISGERSGLNQLVNDKKRNEADFRQRVKFTSLHSLYAGVAYILSGLEKAVNGDEGKESANIDKFKFSVIDDDKGARQYTLGYFGNLLRNAVAQKTVTNGKQLLHFTHEYFKNIEEHLKQQIDNYKFLKKLDGETDLIEDFENTVFDIDGVKLRGFEYEAKVMDKPKIEFKEVQPEEVKGNDLAKKMMIRDVERLALYNFKKQKNPILEFDGLTWSTLLDGFPGTGKTMMMQMEMTYLKKLAEMIGVPFYYWIIDASEKSEYYGKAQRDYRAKLERTLDPNALNLVYFDDVDLLIPGRNIQGMNSADQDILKLFMDYLAGIGTIFRGNTISRAATNVATALDDAFRQRFKQRFLVVGPTTDQQCSDIMVIKFRKQIKNGLLTVAEGKGYSIDHSVEEQAHMFDEETVKILKAAKKTVKSDVTWADIGHLLAEYKKIDPRFTGRAMDNIYSNVVAKSMDFDIPQEWYEKPEIFFQQTYDEQVKLIKGLIDPINPQLILEETDRYWQSEKRYHSDEHTKRVSDRIEDIKVDLEARNEIMKPDEKDKK